MVHCFADLVKRQPAKAVQACSSRPLPVRQYVRMALTPTDRRSLADSLRAEIYSGEPDRSPGTVLSGRKLAEHLGCARKTLIGAMEILEQEGLIRRLPKVGYMILTPAAAFEARIDEHGHVHPVLEQAGDTVEVVTTAVQKAPDHVAAALGVPPETSVVLRQSVLSRSGSPWAIREMYIPRGIADVARRLLEADLVDEAAVMTEAGLAETAHQHTTSARLATDIESALLKSRTAVALSVRRVSYSGEQARSCDFMNIRADRVALTDWSGHVPNCGESDVK
ncbi:GntR family transcriptional regulator [Streptomyces sp. NBC_01433]|uniref:GntR family transcriptional regulator n=1 Tax=Streptomyces sp. NBC_01433 TaxID=2903864 RepID=UPI002254DFEF|nr:GntR family transcriptional regulator [Streptomyces sp. NBC_01433]MCX4682320.1 GntR family transcriptional regulator [Streptomyces sp. NBC_01433]